MAKITASLLQAYDWYLAHPSTQALQRIYNSLTKGFTGSVATERGEKYENYVNKTLLEGTEFTQECEQRVLSPRLKGCSQQDWITPFDVETSNGIFTFKGRTDYQGDDIVYDLKTTKRFKEEDYHKKWQHTVYALATKKSSFEYLVAVFPDDTGLTPIDIHVVHPEVQPIETLATKVDECVKFMLEHYRREFSEWSGWQDKETEKLETEVEF